MSSPFAGQIPDTTIRLNVRWGTCSCGRTPAYSDLAEYLGIIDGRHVCILCEPYQCGCGIWITEYRESVWNRPVVLKQFREAPAIKLVPMPEF